MYNIISSSFSFIISAFRLPSIGISASLPLLFLLLFFTACKDTNSRETATIPAVDTVSTPEPVAEKASKKVNLYAWVDRLRMRAAPNKKADVVEEIAEGGQLLFLDEKSDFTEKISLRGTLFDEPWLKVESPQGKIGWVYGGGVKFYAPKIDAAPSPYDACNELREANKWERYHKCTEEVRKKQLSINSRWAKETEKGVFLTLLDGQEAAFISKVAQAIDEQEDYLQYHYSFYIPQMGYHVLRMYGFEWSAYLLVNDKSGKSIQITGYPKPSPDFKHLFISNLDLEAGFEYNGIGLWGFTENGFEQVYEQEMMDYGPLNPIWLDNDTVELTLQPSPEREDLNMVKRQLVRGTRGDWRMVD